MRAGTASAGTLSFKKSRRPINLVVREFSIVMCLLCHTPSNPIKEQTSCGFVPSFGGPDGAESNLWRWTLRQTSVERISMSPSQSASFARDQAVSVRRDHPDARLMPQGLVDSKRVGPLFRADPIIRALPLGESEHMIAGGFRRTSAST